jgi:hypothetical protein
MKVIMPMSNEGEAKPKREPSEESLRVAYLYCQRFIEYTELERIHLFQIYIAVLGASITGGAMIFAYGMGKIRFSILSIPLIVILLFLAFLSFILYHMFLTWDQTYIYNVVALGWISEKLGLARRMPENKRKDLLDRYKKLNEEYRGLLRVMPLLKRDKIPDWVLIDELYGSFAPFTSIQLHRWYNLLMLTFTGGSLTLSFLIILYVKLHLSIPIIIILGVLIFYIIYRALIKYSRKIQKKASKEVDLLNKFRKPEDIRISGWEEE